MENKIYQEESVIIIAPLKARIYNEEYEKNEFYNADGKKVMVFREKTSTIPNHEWYTITPDKETTGGFGVGIKAD